MGRKVPDKNKSGVYAGSFDPITKGHLDIIYQAATLLDRLYIMVGVNPGKNPLFTPDERVAMIRHEIDTITKPKLKKNGWKCDIRIEKHDGLTAHFMKAHNAPFYVRGLRIGMEFDNEYPALIAGKGEYKEFTPLFFCTADPLLQVVSSSMARELERFNGKTTGKYVTPHVHKLLRKRMDERSSGNNHS